MTERIDPTTEVDPSVLFMSGDDIIVNPEVAWDTTIVVPKPLDEVWEGRYGVSRMGAVDEGYAALALPRRYDPMLSKKLRSLPVGGPLPKQLVEGDAIPDGHGSDRAVVRYINSEGPEKSVVFETEWTKKDGTKGLHYVWEVSAKEGDSPDQTIVTTRTYMENLKHPRAAALFGPSIDRFAMKLVGEGLARDDTDPSTTLGWRQKYGKSAVAAVAAGLASRELTKRSHSNAVRFVAPAVGAIAGAAIAYRASRNRPNVTPRQR